MRGKFKDIVTDLAENDPRVIVLLGDISVFQFRHFQARFPDRFHNMGICENALISVAASWPAKATIRLCTLSRRYHRSQF